VIVVDLATACTSSTTQGQFEEEVEPIGFLEGNSNLGYALGFDPVGDRPAYCRR
jgi:hypothetical protein